MATLKMKDRFVHLVKVDGFQEMEFVVGDGPSHLGSHACWKVRASSDERAIGAVGAHYVASMTVRVTCDRLW